MTPFDVHDGRRRERRQKSALEGNRCHPSKRLAGTQRVWSGLTRVSQKARPTQKKYAFALGRCVVPLTAE